MLGVFCHWAGAGFWSFNFFFCNNQTLPQCWRGSTRVSLRVQVKWCRISSTNSMVYLKESILYSCPASTSPSKWATRKRALDPLTTIHLSSSDVHWSLHLHLSLWWRAPVFETHLWSRQEFDIKIWKYQVAQSGAIASARHIQRNPKVIYTQIYTFH